MGCANLGLFACGWDMDDDYDFTVSVMCCVCGGGYTASPAPPPLPPLPPPLPPYPPGAAPQPPPPYAFTDTASLKTAAQEYNADADSATATYGPISSWGVSAITSMYQLFYNLAQFNADISSWDTSGVTDMSYMFWVRSARALAAATTVERSLHVACAAATAHIFPSPGPHVTPLPMLPYRLGSKRRRLTSR